MYRHTVEYHSTMTKIMVTSWMNLKILVLNAKKVDFYGSIMSYIRGKLTHMTESRWVVALVWGERGVS